MQIHGPSHVHGPHGINPPHFGRTGRAEQPSAPTRTAGDQLDISAAAAAVVRASESGEIRSDLVNRIRAEIAAGTYITPQKLDQALERFLDEQA